MCDWECVVPTVRLHAPSTMAGNLAQHLHIEKSFNKFEFDLITKESICKIRKQNKVIK